MPENHVPEWYIEATRTCLIPRIGFGDGTKEIKHNSDEKVKLEDKTITSMSDICGQLLAFSYCAESQDNMKCYISWNKQTSYSFI